MAYYARSLTQHLLAREEAYPHSGTAAVKDDPTFKEQRIAWYQENMTMLVQLLLGLQ
jgi:hypothetical protein